MSVTVEITLYEVDELTPEAFEKAHRAFVEDLWRDGWGTEYVSDSLRWEADRQGPDELAVFAGRFLSWDLYRGWVEYDSGPLNYYEREKLAKVCPSLAPYVEDAKLEFYSGRIRQHVDYWYEIPEDVWPGVEAEINEYLDRLYTALRKVMDADERWLESEGYFREHAEANEYLFHGDGRLA